MVDASMKADLADIYRRLIMKSDTTINVSSVILSDVNKEKIANFIQEQRNAQNLAEFGLLPMNRILMYGASGTGKTMLTQALSNLFGYPLLSVNIAEALADGVVARNIADIFKLATYLKKCIVFFDECDSIAWNRSAANGESGDVRRATESLFQYMDRLDPVTMFVGATNLLNMLDAAFERRFNLKMEFRRPSIVIRDEVKRFMHPAFTLIEDVDTKLYLDVEHRTNQSSKLSWDEIRGIVNRAMKRAVIDKTMKMSMAEILRDFSVTLQFKLAFKTNHDPERMFQSAITAATNNEL